MGTHVLDASEKISEAVTKIYLFSGMGADSRLFKNIGPFEGYEIVPLPYIHPKKSQTLREYAELLVAHYSFEEPYFLGGVSQGGMIAQELAQLLKPKGLVLISTATLRSEMPLLFDWVRRLGLSAVWSKSVLEPVASMADRFTIKSPEGRKLFMEMLRDSDPDFMRFGAKAILEWSPPQVDVPVIRIHGTVDRVFPFSKVRNAIPIKGGNHFMIFERAQEITDILEKSLDALD